MPYKDPKADYAWHKKWSKTPAGKVSAIERTKRWRHSTKGKACMDRYYATPVYKKKQYELHLKRKFGITLAEYDEIIKKQSNRCAICNTHQADLTKSLAVDHNHVTGQVRGLLCDPCNRGIGLLKESVGVLSKAVDYLQNIKVNKEA